MLYEVITIVGGMVVDQDIIPNMRELEMFDFFWVGFPMLVVGFLYLYFFSYRLLPAKKSVIDNFVENERKYLVEAMVRKNSKLAGLSLEEADLLMACPAGL